MKRGKRVLGAVALVLIVAAMTAIFVSCEKKEPIPPPGSIPFEYKLNSVDELKVCLGDYVKLPLSSQNIYNIYKKSFDYRMNGNIEYDPYLQWAEWNDVVDEVTISVKFYKSYGNPFNTDLNEHELMIYNGGTYYYYRQYIWQNEEEHGNPISLTEIKADGAYSNEQREVVYKYIKSFS